MNIVEKFGIEGNPSQGPFIQISLKIILDSNIVTGINFKTHQCGILKAVCCTLMDMVVGQSLENVKKITEEIFLEKVGWLPLGKQHYPKMVITALKKALDS